MKIGKIIYEAITAAILIIVVLLVILLIGIKLIGFTPYAVLSGSMEPLYSVGSAVYVKAVDAEDIEVGDVITFTMSSGDTVVTHQVIEIDEEQGYYYTQGLANDTADGSPTTIDNIIGKVSFGIPYLGYVATYATSPPWIYIMVAVVLIWIIIMYMMDIYKEEEQSSDELSESQKLKLEKKQRIARRKSRGRDRRKAAQKKRREYDRF